MIYEGMGEIEKIIIIESAYHLYTYLVIIPRLSISMPLFLSC